MKHRTYIAIFHTSTPAVAETLYALLLSKGYKPALSGDGSLKVALNCMRNEVGVSIYAAPSNKSIYTTNQLTGQSNSFDHERHIDADKDLKTAVEAIVNYKPKKQLKLNDTYTATVLPEEKSVEVGCQKFPFQVIDKLHKLIHEPV